MGPKKAKTRKASGNCFGPAVTLPDTGNLYTLRYVMSAYEWEFELNPLLTKNFIAEHLEPKIRQKWKQNNPELPLISTKLLVQRLARDYSSVVEIKRKQLTKVKTENFMQRLDKLYDLLICQCKFISCEQVQCPDVDCHGAHMECS